MTKVELLKKYAYGETDVNMAEIGERVLLGEADNLDLAFIRLAPSSNRAEMWENYMKRWQQVLGSLFKFGDMHYLMSQHHCICSRTSCMELAVNGVCYLHDKA